MPVKAPVEGWVQRDGAPDIAGVVDHVLRLVGEFPLHALQGQPGEGRRLRIVRVPYETISLAPPPRKPVGRQAEAA